MAWFKTEDGYESVVLSKGRLASRVLPGFFIEVDWLWQEPLPSTLARVRAILG
jgi:hypothetical protein